MVFSAKLEFFYNPFLNQATTLILETIFSHYKNMPAKKRATINYDKNENPLVTKLLFWIGPPLSGSVPSNFKIIYLDKTVTFFIGRDMEFLSHYFANEILSHPTEGSFYLGGFCFGGLIAFEVARKLESLDYKISLLVIADPWLPKVENTSLKIIRRSLLSLCHPKTVLSYVGNIIQKFARPETIKKNIKPNKAEVEAKLWANVAYKATANYKMRALNGCQLNLIVGNKTVKRFLLDYFWGEFAENGIKTHVIEAESPEDLSCNGKIMEVLTQLV